MRKNTPKRAAQLREYKIAREEYFKDNPECEVCGSSLIVLHHKRGRRGERLMNKTYFMSVCDLHHKDIHDNPEMSYEKGYLIKG